MQTQIENLFERVSHLPEETQNNLLFFWNQDIENEINFDKNITDDFDKINTLAQTALSEFCQNKTTEMGFDEL